MEIDWELEALLAQGRACGLRFPLDSKDEFVRQMTSSGNPIVFRGRAYPARWVASLVPAFFFPIASEQELVMKAVELMVARGLRPVSDIEESR